MKFSRLLNPKCQLLKQLGKGISFEIAVGMNGRIWLKAKSVRQTLAVAKALSISEHMDAHEMNSMCRKLIDGLSGF